MFKHSKWNPIEVFLLVSATLSGLAATLNLQSSSRAVQEIVPPIVLYVWYPCLSASAVAVLYGLFKYNYRVAAGGYSIASAISFAYAVIIFSYGGAPFAYSAMITVGFAIAGIFRGLQLFNLQHKAEKEVLNNEAS